MRSALSASAWRCAEAGVKSEAEIQTDIRLIAPKFGLQLFRNNVGVAFDATGRAIRYGLANESKEINKKIKSGDLIGWRPLIVTQDMVGKTIAQFVSIECKSQKKHAKIKIAQTTWAELVKKAGGIALILARGLEESDLDA
jgi:hypothetical protein